MKFKEIMTAIGYAPANAFSGLTNLILGSTAKDKKGRPKTDGEGHPVTNYSLLSGVATGLQFALEGVKYVGRAISDFIAAHKKAIAVAAWLSLAAAGAVALTLFLWPAALAAVATFSIGGLSIAAIAGASTVAQIGLAAGLTAAAVSAATYITAAVVNGINWLVDCCKSMRNKSSNVSILELDTEKLTSAKNDHGHDQDPDLSRKFQGLNVKTDNKTNIVTTSSISNSQPFQPPNQDDLFKTPVTRNVGNDTPVVVNSTTATL